MLNDIQKKLKEYNKKKGDLFFSHLLSMKKILTILFLIFTPYSSVFAGYPPMEPPPDKKDKTNESNLTSSFPPRFAAYSQLLLPERATLSEPCKVGTIYNDSVLNELRICVENGAGLDYGVWRNFSNVWTQNVNQIHLTDTSDPLKKRVGIGTSTPEFKLTLEGDGGIIAKGIFGEGQMVGFTGGGDGFFFWNPRKAAIRAGKEFGNFWDDSRLGDYSVGLGSNNLSSGNYSVVGGGASDGQWVNQDYATLVAGKSNKILDNVTAVHPDAFGPYLPNPTTSYTTAKYATTIGGGPNLVGGDYSFIGGGNWQWSVANYSTIGGGSVNHAGNPSGASTQTHITIIGGQKNYIDGRYSTVAGGIDNVILSDYGAVTGGHRAEIFSDADYASIAGGVSNEILFRYGSIAGGFNGASVGDFGSIGGGETNNIENEGNYGVIGGGLENTIKDGQEFGSIGGGTNNFIDNSYGSIGAGHNNKAHLYSALGGGENNEASDFSFVGGGLNNKIIGTARYSMIAGGKDNKIASSYSWVGGYGIELLPAADQTFAWGVAIDGVTSNPIKLSAKDAFLIYPEYDAARGLMGIGVIKNLEAKLHIKGNIKIDDPGTGGSLILSTPAALVAPPAVDLYINAGGTIGLNDLAENFETSEPVAIGDALVVDENNKHKLKKSSSAYDSKVVGVVSAAPAVILEGHTMKMSTPAFSFTEGTNPPVALAGQVLCKVSLENGPIEEGDLLTTASLPGHVMKATDPDKAFGAVVGRALESFNENDENKTTGMIMVLVNRQ